MRELKRICVYCGSQVGDRGEFRVAAAELGRLLGERRIGVVYGGGNIGLMGVVADAALAAGGEVIGVIPQSLAERELAHHGVTRLEVVGSMHERKQRMADLSDAFVALPGGLGTLEELFEAWTWLQLGYHTKRVGLVNTAGFFGSLLRFLDEATERKFMRPVHRDALVVADSPAELLDRFGVSRLG